MADCWSEEVTTLFAGAVEIVAFWGAMAGEKSYRWVGGGMAGVCDGRLG